MEADEKKIQYRQEGDYQIPNLKCNLPSPESIGKYGLMRKDYLKKHKRVQYSIKLMEDTLTEHLLEVQTRAEKQVEMWEKAYLQKYPAPDKEAHQMEWVQYMNMVRMMAEEAVLPEVIYS